MCWKRDAFKASWTNERPSIILVDTGFFAADVRNELLWTLLGAISWKSQLSLARKLLQDRWSAEESFDALLSLFACCQTLKGETHVVYLGMKLLPHRKLLPEFLGDGHDGVGC